MSETAPRNQQFVGSSEAPSSKELAFTPEQQQVMSTLQEQGIKLDKNVLEARKKAGKQLQRLHGKELFKAGWKQSVFGIFGDFISAFGSGIAKGKISDVFLNKDTAVVNRYLTEHGEFNSIVANIFTAAGENNYQPLSDYLGYTVDQNNFSNAVTTFEELEREKRGHMKRASDEQRKALKERQPILENRAGFISKAVSVELSGLGYMLYQKGKNLPPLTWYDWAIGQVGIIQLHLPFADLINVNPLNPPLVGGIRNMITGLYQMATGK